MPYDPAKLVALIVAAVLWGLLVYRDARRAESLSDLLARTRHPLVAVSLVGTVLSGVGVTLMIIGVYMVFTARGLPGITPPTMRTLIVGGVLVIVGWLARLLSWRKWKKIVGDGDSAGGGSGRGGRR